ncbi:hypothetical protein BBOV_III009540 [Babesia bovis T2Bo]|uniref:RAP domain-containing protein n=1 Tax=Babesia bovis TaxID=5865 RepID=A7APM6_BABBO|nr:hypothetical protein BBOV_III009540 [Babesia bovis T2Bo]EDO08510.1 hypothetical protein BBOV_III009540 [Babesia bovis T2Bo]|eukprot:XP_001612078.1 hypothetical protein [Babesia bovis T2Bo]
MRLVYHSRATRLSRAVLASETLIGTPYVIGHLGAQNDMYISRPLRLMFIKNRGRYLTTSVSHDDFVKQCNDESLDHEATSFEATIKPSGTLKQYKAKSRFSATNVQEQDMYSAKPVWQQLNDIESKWNMHFRHKTRIDSQKSIAKAKKSVESLDSIESNESRLIDLDTFRSSTKRSASAPENVTVTESHKLEPMTVPSHRIPKSNTLNSLSNVAPGDQLVNDLHLKGDAYYEAVPIDTGMEPALETDTLSTKELRLKESVSPEAMIGRLLTDSERSVLESIMPTQPAGVIDAASPAAVIAAETKLEPETWLNMDPGHIVLQQSILKCKSSSQVLAAIQDKVTKLNAVNAATALHRIARHTTSYSRYTLTGNNTFAQLLSAVEAHIATLDPQGVTNVLWSIVKLRIHPQWMDSLLVTMQKHVKELGTSELASSLFAVSKLATMSTAGIDLRDMLLGTVQEKVTHFRTPLDITCVATALARLNVRNPVIFSQLSAAVLAVIDDFAMQQLCGIAWAYASLGFSDKALFRKIRLIIESKASGTNIGDVVHLTWALSKLREADHELFLCTVSPLVRSHIAHLRCRDISTIAWAYLNADIEDTDLFEDLASALLHHVDEMTTRDISAAVAAFAHMAEEHKTLFKKMRNRAQLMLNEFTPLQLAKITRGFIAVSDERFYSQLCKVIESKVYLMLPENVVEILMGLMEASQVPPLLLKKLIETVSTGAHKMYAEDCLLLLQVATTLKKQSDPTLMSALDKLASAMVDQIERRVSRWRCYNIEHISLFFECLAAMGIGGSKGDSAVRTLAKHMASCLNRLMNNNVSGDHKNKVIQEYIKACAGLPPRKLAILSAELSKSTEFMRAMHGVVASLSSCHDLDVVETVHNLIKMGYMDDSVIAMCDTVAGMNQNDANATTLSKAVYALTEANLHLPWVRKVLKVAIDMDDANPESMISLMWSCVVLGEDEILVQMLNKYVPTFDELPTDMLQAQQVALHVMHCLMPGNNEMYPNELVATNSQDEHESISNLTKWNINPDVITTLQEWLDYQRDDLYTISQGGRKKRAIELDYDNMLSECLIQMKIPHKTVHTIQNVYKASVAFPLERHLIDVLSFSDCFIPHGKPRSRALLRQRQLKLMGYGVVSIQLTKLYESSREGTTRQLIAKALSSFCDAAVDYLPPGE